MKHAQAAIVLGLSGVALWVLTRMQWLTVAAFDDKSGAKQLSLTGGQWHPEIVAIGMLLMVAGVIGLSRAVILRRISGVCAGLGAGAVAAISALSVVNEPDQAQILTFLTSSQFTHRLSAWATIEQLEVQSAPPILTVICALIGFGAALVGLASTNQTAQREQTRRRDKYQRAAVSRDHITEDLRTDPESERVLWDALDADIDPTDQDGRI
ncbi:TIGR02234 family membrane protein [Corynebacterium sp. HS2168-gen11]|uniref:TIGR02234 family membrane protein n=1 Tax=Corynebacterium sp. HS2168-gen11 TaxID=2974027 RepID=UPI00216B30B7|nr:TIGR02234 family membrane protein [Corynebacterium sp. HS2168-gen11]MCS4536246.1 TIGR02234 family membrane protein [Corynebacterium sp. HS2168-gen11]